MTIDYGKIQAALALAPGNPIYLKGDPYDVEFHKHAMSYVAQLMDHCMELQSIIHKLSKTDSGAELFEQER